MSSSAQGESEDSVSLTVADTRTGRKPTACVECYQRKTKCDRAYPCTACIRAKRSCISPGPRPPRKPRRRNHYEFHDRLARLETHLRVLNTVSERREDDKSRDGAKCLACLGDTAEFAESQLWLTAVKEFNTVKQQLYNEMNELGPWPELNMPFDADDLLVPTLSVNNGPLPHVPTSNELQILWKTFLERIQPVIPILHVPTFNTTVTYAFSDFIALPPTTKALLWSICCMALTSFSRDEYNNVSYHEKDEMIALYSRQCRLALLKANYLANFNLDTLRCLIFLTMSSQSLHNDSESWVTHGNLVRMAYKLGLHRDGTEFDLKPFEVEMRRRVWWQTLTLELSHALRCGLLKPELPSYWTTRIPHNVNDKDLHPDMIDPVTSIDGPADTTYCVMACEASKILLESDFSSLEEALMACPQSQGNTQAQSVPAAAYELLTLKINLRLGFLERCYCKASSGPIYDMALGLRPSIIRIFKNAMISQDSVTGMGEEFRRAHLEREEYFQDSLEKTHPWFRWTAWVGFRLRVIYHLIGQLEQCSDDRFVHRTWCLMERLYTNHEALWNFSDEAVMEVAYIILRAWEKRAMQLISNSIQATPDEPKFVKSLRLRLLGERITSTGPDDMLLH
ncbi:hypothetical protein FOMG_17692 [Fusarium oxysporum f. sp. melonis 26406]|uniref:Zn(2)-C6 fungal-type domain-containing protein n=1 Tax=Fusarium oxysporum f. sp. melonis 26406 TaxID=1089452 RepID=W9Z2N4_FUSOX|nr:hypothetical protein FOMG_17692 [Fusarium oxysporum f. sp. melonis 26406]